MLIRVEELVIQYTFQDFFVVLLFPEPVAISD